MKIAVLRGAQSEAGTFGMFVPDSLIPFGVSLELPPRDNEQNRSCIPAGTYRCEPFYSPSMRMKVYLLKDVPGREGILIHPGNIMAHTAGCILTGEAFEPVLGENGIAYSKDAFQELVALTKWEPFDLTIIDPPASLRRLTTEV